jgi:ribonuclease D
VGDPNFRDLAEVELIQSESRLNELLLSIKDLRFEAFIDTEFIKRSTYYPKLGLVQVLIQTAPTESQRATEHMQVFGPWLVDPLSLDIKVLFETLLQADRWIMHASGEDLSLIRDLCLTKTPIDQYPPLIDTQILLSFLGFGLQISYQAALDQCLDITIAKAQALSDWLARPLSDEQLTYAALDVLHLPKLLSHAEEHLNSAGQLTWALEDSKHYFLGVMSEPADHERYLAHAHFSYSRLELARLQLICAYREAQARRQDLPRQHVLTHQAVIALALRNPQKPSELHKLKDVSPAERKRHGAAITEMLADLSDKLNDQQSNACVNSNQQLPDKIPPPTKLPKPLSKLFDERLNQIARSAGLDAQLLMRRRWKNQLLQSVKQFDPQAHLPAELLGFREKLIALPLIELLRSEPKA